VLLILIYHLFRLTALLCHQPGQNHGLGYIHDLTLD
jgi:hypothetical protein